MFPGQLLQQLQANYFSCCMLGWHAHMHRSLLQCVLGQALHAAATATYAHMPKQASIHTWGASSGDLASSVSG
jgi:hypothetical protein